MEHNSLGPDPEDVLPPSPQPAGPLASSDPEGNGRYIIGVRRRRQPPRRKLLALLLFLTTCVTTFMAGMGYAPRTASLGTVLWSGVSFAAPLMLILLAHEMGHFLQAVRYHVPASLPYFIPMPAGPFGTMGAVIVQGAGVANRKQMFDIAISGPLAGLILALPFTYFGLLHAKIGVGPPVFGDPLILLWMAESILRPLEHNEQIVLNPMLFAGWVGIFITALNLIPIGQLDGGHILYTLIRKRAHAVALLLLGGALAYMVYTNSYAYSLMVVLLLLMGPRHPPTADDSVPLGPFRVTLGWLTLAFIIIGFTPEPFVMR